MDQAPGSRCSRHKVLSKRAAFPCRFGDERHDSSRDAHRSGPRIAKEIHNLRRAVLDSILNLIPWEYVWMLR